MLENIFSFLDFEDLTSCAQVNTSWKSEAEMSARSPRFTIQLRDMDDIHHYTGMVKKGKKPHKRISIEVLEGQHKACVLSCFELLSPSIKVARVWFTTLRNK